MSQESRVPDGLRFYNAKTIIDLTFARIQFLPDLITEKIRFGVDVPIKAIIE